MTARKLFAPSRTCISTVVVIAFFSALPSHAQLHCSANWTPEYKCMEHCGPCPTTRSTTPRPEDLARQREIQRQLAAAAREEAARKEAERIAAEKKEKAEEANRLGLEAAARGDWRAAANKFMEALEYAPDSADVRANLNRANIALADQGTAADIVALRQRIEDSIAAANLDAIRMHLEDDTTSQRLNQMYDNIRGEPATRPVVRGVNSGVPLMYPVLLRPVPPDSPPAKVLARSQPKIRDIDAEIHSAQESLRRLIKSNGQDEEEREQWIRESEQATIDAKDLSIGLVLDLIGERVDASAEVNKEKRALVLDRLEREADGNGPSKRIVAGYLSLVSRKKDLERLQQELRLAGKVEDLRVRIRDFSIYKDTEFSTENLWDVINQFKKVEGMAGPYKDLLDASYTIYRQAVSFQRLSAIRANNEKTLEAANALRRYIVRLEAKKQSARIQTARHVP